MLIENIRIMKRILLVFLVLTIQQLKAQYEVIGKVLDEESKKPLSQVQIKLSGLPTGTLTDSAGYFSLSVSVKKGILTFHAIGYQETSRKFTIKGQKRYLGNIKLVASSYSLDEITISAGLAEKERSPVTVKEISSRVIKTELGDRPLPMLFNSTPGVFSTRAGGGTGDAEVNIRGFKQENIGVLLNGVPVNGEENGLVYWSNWQGLADASATIQIQKGPGVANMAVNAVGGSINIITINPDKPKSGMASIGITSYGNTKLLLTLNSGKTENNWDVSFMGSYERGPGFVDATYVRSWAYFLSATKTFNSKHKLNFTLLGAPQKHGQRTLRLTKKEIDLHGYLFNKDWGGYNGEIKNASENFYHKPFLTVNHYFRIDNKKSFANTLYISYGSGGGLWSESFNYAPSIFSYRNPSDQIDWPAIYENNANNTDKYILENGDTVTGYSHNVQTKFLASHVVTGLMSTYKQKLSQILTFKVGGNYKYFNSFLREEIYDLLGGNFFIEDYSWALEGVSGRNQIKMPGDIIRVDNNSVINFISGYAQLLLDSKKWNGYLSINGNNNFYKRIDRFNYVTDQKSDIISKPGFDVRSGWAFKPGTHHKIYINGAYLSKAPYFKYVFGNYTNVPVKNLKNEKVGTVEAGYVFHNSSLYVSVAGYLTSWKNVSLLSNEYIQLEDNKQTRAMVNGLNSLHTGFESEISYRFQNGWKLSAFASFADFKWKNNVQATLFNDNNFPVDTVFVYAKDLYVGGTAQQQLGASFYFSVFRLINLHTEWIWYNKLYANFDPVNRNNADDTKQPYRFPSYNVVNFYLNTPFNIGKKTASFDLGMYNILNQHYIEMGDDGVNHDLETFKGFWAPGFTFNARVSFYF
jgi:outer membrane cobalamin receptor